MLPQFKLQPVPFTYVPTNYLLIIPAFYAVPSETLTVPLDEQAVPKLVINMQIIGTSFITIVSSVLCCSCVCCIIILHTVLYLCAVL
jgi:hypothetical protein